MGLCYFTKSTGAAKRLPANPSDPLTTRHGFARVAEPAGRSCCQACIISSLSQRQLDCGLQNSPHSLKLITSMLFSHQPRLLAVLSCGNGLWNQGKCSVYNILELMSADSSGRETRLLSGFSLGGDSSRYCMTADKYAWTHPGRVINSSVIGVFIMQTEIDTQGSDFSGFLLQKKGRKSHFSNAWKAGGSLKSCLTVLLCYS